MNAIELIRSNIDLAKEIITVAPDEANEYSAWGEVGFYRTCGEKCEKWNPHYKWWTLVLYNSFMKQHRNLLSELKRYIESVDLVENNGGLESVEDSFNFAWMHGLDELTEHGERLKQAVADYKLIYKEPS